MVRVLEELSFILVQKDINIEEKEYFLPLPMQFFVQFLVSIAIKLT